ncbi:thioredoxin domain-containing protein [Planococcus citri]|uniref:thioredoxin domain-containing protein n=1 Tax=Planococcus citri TaxID=170843 RepID=UPI0031F921CC
MKLFSLISAIFVILCVISDIHSSGLEQMSDDDLLNLIRTENYVAVLFTKKDCEICDKHEDVLFQIREDLVDSLSAWVVKAVNSQLVRIYSPSKEPALVFFRHGIPLLYDGELNDELILHTLSENKEPCVRELHDENFEHLTQVSTGATTGDWFILFYSTDCIECQNLQARWESVCAKLKTRMNVARINKQTMGKVIGRRFGVSKVPSFIFFRHGKMYRYNSQKYDIDSLHSFPIETHKNARVEPVTPPKAPLEDMLLGILEFFRECPFLVKIISTIIGVFVIVSVAYKMNSRKEKKKKSTSKRSKNK